MSLPARTDIDPAYRFDLTSIFETPAEWERAVEGLRDRLDDLDALAAEPVESADDLGALLDTVADCFRRRQRIDLYAQLAANVATGSDEAADRTHRAEQLAEQFEPAITAAIRRLRDCDDAHIGALPEEDRRYARNLREQGAHVRSGPVEEAIAAFEQPLDASSRMTRAVTDEDFDPPTVERPDGETVEIRYGNRRTELSHENRDYRQRVFEAYHDRMDRYEHTLVQAFAEKLHAARAEVSVRGYGSLRERALHQRCYPESGLRASLPGEVHDTMLAAVRDSLDPFHEALALRRRRLGVEQLRPWDLDVSLAPGDPPTVEYDDALEHILAALDPLGEGYVDRLRAFFDERRIDVFPTEGKRTDIPAYCPSSSTDGAYILANFEADVRTMFYICHELGHAMHVEHLREGRPRYAAGPRPTEEIPSILHELLLVDHLVEEGGALADAARNRLLECVAGNFYGAARSAVFTHELAGRVEDGEEVTTARVRELAGALREEFYAPVAFGDQPGRKLPVSGVRKLYSNYQYVLGATGALAVHRALRADDLSTGEYRAFLRSSGRRESVALFEQLGCDIHRPDPFETAARTFGEYVSAFDAAWE